MVALQSIAKHSAELAKTVVRYETLGIINSCLEEFDSCVKENAALCLSSIARHNEELAQAVVDSGSLPLLLMSLQEPDVNLRRAAVTVLGDIAKHSIILAQSVVDVSGILHLSRQTTNACPKLKVRQMNLLS